MKKLEIIKLINEVPYLKNNLTKNLHGIILEKSKTKSKVLFFNPQNVGRYAIVEVNNQDIILENETLPINIENEIILNLDAILSKANSILEPVSIKAYTTVQLIVDDPKYTRFGIHKGEIGCVMENSAIQDYIEVDFSGINQKGEYYGDCISVKICDLKVIEK